jgi:hypothetical protein
MNRCVISVSPGRTDAVLKVNDVPLPGNLFDMEETFHEWPSTDEPPSLLEMP